MKYIHFLETQFLSEYKVEQTVGDGTFWKQKMDPSMNIINYMLSYYTESQEKQQFGF